MLENTLRPPKVLHRVKAEYPASVRERKIEGPVRLQIVIRPDGTVGEIGVARSLDPELDQQAILAVRQWLFEPAIVGGQAVESRGTVEIPFSVA
ncbi:energy transducer TonB [Bryobacter aggregatus]|uniref:energy transducer TonB n=1 Tax=Bryobacter aggregatus TaxID=360054 RepID=UPI0004E0AFCA|nr:energy transducer TonB [Bryobacter aggregatus]